MSFCNLNIIGDQMSSKNKLLALIFLGILNYANLSYGQNPETIKEFNVEKSTIESFDRDWKVCTTKLAKKIKDHAFSGLKDRTFDLSSRFKYRYSPNDGYKIWFSVTEIAGEEKKYDAYFIAMRVKYIYKPIDAPHSFEFPGNCVVNLNTGNPFYITDSRGNLMSSFDGRTIPGRIGDLTLEFVGKMIASKYQTTGPSYGGLMK